MAINALIIDDNPQAAQSVEEMLAEYPKICLCGKATTLDEAEEMIFEYKPALIFLDIEMPDGNGLDFWNETRPMVTWMMHVVFYTAFDNFAIEALRAKAYDYLVKPVSRAHFKAAMKRFFLDCAERFVESQNGVSIGPDNTSPMILVVDSGGNKTALKAQDICFFRYVKERKIWQVVCCDGNFHTLRHGVNASKLISLSSVFALVNKSYIVNVSYISSIENNRVIFLPPYDDFDDVMISKNYRNELFNHFCQL